VAVTTPAEDLAACQRANAALRVELDSATRQRDELLDVIEGMRAGLVGDIQTAVRVHVTEPVEGSRRGARAVPNG